MVVVTGASTGLGRVIARGAATAGARAVIVNFARSAEQSEITAQLVGEAGAACVLVQGDANNSSSSGQSGAKMAHYSSSKGAMIAFTRTLAVEFGEYDITSNTIPPRFVHNTEMSLASFERDDMSERFQAMIDAGPIRRHGEPEDIAGAAAWLASDEAGYVTGQVIGVNGGRYI